MKQIMKLATFAAVTLLPAVAFAGKGGISATGLINVVPVGTFHVEGGGFSGEDDLDLAYGFGAQVDYWVTDAISVGFAPRYILNVIPKDADGDAATELDLAVRAQYNHTVNEKISAFGFLSPGFSSILPPGDSDSDSATGLIIGFGAGGRYGINEKLFAQGELGYQLGFQGNTQMGVDVTTSTRFLHIGVGVGSHF